MNEQPQGRFRPTVYLSNCMVIFLLLTVTAAFAQQQKTTLAPKNQAVSDTNDRIAQLAQATSARQGDYTIGSGDLLGVDVFDVPELSREVRVN